MYGPMYAGPNTFPEPGLVNVMLTEPARAAAGSSHMAVSRPTVSNFLNDASWTVLYPEQFDALDA